MKINLNLDNYPHLKDLAETDQMSFSMFLKNIMEFADVSIAEKHHIQARQHFDMSFPSLLGELVDALFDYKGILSHHHSPKEAKLLEILGMENNPLLAKNFYRIEDGEMISREEFFAGEGSIKEWFQSMLYAGRYLSHADLVRYLTLGEFDLVERMKTDRIIELLKIQPALAYQAQHDLIVGKRVSGTGFFDCGNRTIDPNRTECFICLVKGEITKFEDYLFCHNCLGAINVKERD